MVCFLLSLLQVRSLTGVRGKAVSGGLLDPMSSPATSGNTRVPSPSSATIAGAASPAPITWHSTWRGTSEVGQSVPTLTFNRNTHDIPAQQDQHKKHQSLPPRRQRHRITLPGWQWACPLSDLGTTVTLTWPFFTIDEWHVREDN